MRGREDAVQPGDKVKVSLNSVDWSQGREGKVFIFITHAEVDRSLAIVCPQDAKQYLKIDGLYPVRQCRECGQELPEK